MRRLSEAEPPASAFHFWISVSDYLLWIFFPLSPYETIVGSGRFIQTLEHAVINLEVSLEYYTALMAHPELLVNLGPGAILHWWAHPKLLVSLECFTVLMGSPRAAGQLGVLHCFDDSASTSTIIQWSSYLPAPQMVLSTTWPHGQLSVCVWLGTNKSFSLPPNKQAWLNMLELKTNRPPFTEGRKQLPTEAVQEDFVTLHNHVHKRWIPFILKETTFQSD